MHRLSHFVSHSPVGPATGALGLRWIFCWVVFPLFLSAHSTVGTQYELDGYRQLAAQIVAGHGYRISPSAPANLNRPPAYALLLTLAAPWNDRSYLFFQALNGLLGALSVVVTWKLTREAGGGDAAAAIASWSLALWPFSIWETKVSVPENLLVLLLPATVLCAVLWWRRGRAAFAAAAGALAGLAALTHALDQLLVAAVPLAILTSRKPLRSRLVSAVTALLTGLLIVLPWTLRNESIAGYRFGVSTGLGLHYLKGLYDYDILRSGGHYFRDNDDAAMKEAIRWLARNGVHAGDDESLRNDPAINRLLDRAARRDLERRPLFNLTKMVAKMPLLWVQQQTPIRAAATAILLLPFFLLAGLALRSCDWPSGLTILILAVVNAGSALVFIEAIPMRYALPLLPLLFTLSGRGFEQLVARHSNSNVPRCWRGLRKTTARKLHGPEQCRRLESSATNSGHSTNRK